MIGPDLFFMEVVSKYKKVNLPAIVVEHMNIVMNTKDGKHGLAYEFWLNKIFAYFSVVYGKWKTSSIKQVVIP